MKTWILHNRKLSLIIVALSFIVLSLLRVFVFHEIAPNGEADNTALIRSFFDNLMATILVTVSVTIALSWFRSPFDENISETFIQPFEIDECLREGAEDTREWYYLGHTGRYIRSQILPFINRDSLAKNENKKIKTIILDPFNPNLCEFYATYRNDSRSIHITKDKWSADRVRNDLLATVLCMIELQQANSMLEVEVGFLSNVSLFRADICSKMVLITQEDNQEPGIRYSSDSHFYRCYRRELELSWRQSRIVNIKNAKTRLDLSDVNSIRTCLKEVGLYASLLQNASLKEAGAQALQKESPYVSK